MNLILKKKTVHRIDSVVDVAWRIRIR